MWEAQINLIFFFKNPGGGGGGQNPSYTLSGFASFDHRPSGIQSLMNVYMLFSAHVQVLFVIIRVCGTNLKANNFQSSNST